MTAAITNPPPWIELPAIVAGAAAGALFAQKRGLDIVGILALALVSGLGGGMLRDVLLARVPLALRETQYLATVAGSAVVAALFAEAANRLKFAMQMIDAVSLGLFSVIGAQSALLADLPIASAILLGTITGIGGGLLRDILVGDVPPRTLQRGAPYATAAFIGAGLYIGLVELGVAKVVAQIAVVVLVCLIRGVAIWRGWEVPTPQDITPKFLRSRATRDAAVTEEDPPRPP